MTLDPVTLEIERLNTFYTCSWCPYPGLTDGIAWNVCWPARDNYFVITGIIVMF